MKTIIWPGSVLRATPEERAARRPLGRDPEAWSAMVEDQRRIARYSEDAGIDAIGTTEHHFQTEGGETVANSLLLYGYLASLTKKIKYMPLSLAPVTRDPIRTAEDLAIFDQLYPGRLNGVGFARGYQTRWMQTLAQEEAIASTPMDPNSDARNRERFEENIEIIQKAWAQDSFSHDGAHYKVPFPAEGVANWPATPWTQKYGAPGDVDESGTVKRVGIVPKPLQNPEIFIPSTVSPRTVEWAAEQGFIPLLLSSWKEKFKPVAESYRDDARKAGHDVALGERIGAVRGVVFGDTYEEAFELAVRGSGYWFNNFFSNFGILEGFRIDSDDRTKMLQFDEDRDLVKRMVDLGQISLGTPETVIEELLELKSCWGDGDLEWLVWEFWCQGLPGDEGSEIAKHQIELFGKHVIPAIS